MSHDHASGGRRHWRRLAFALALTAAYTVVEGTVGIVSGSLVLIADAGHMLTDVAALTLSLVAIWFAQRPASRERTFGYYRVEILAALFNAVLLFAISGFIMFEAIDRFRNPPDVSALPLILVGLGGLLVNGTSAFVLFAGAGTSLNVKGAFLEVVSDALGSFGAVLAGLTLLFTGSPYADPIFAVGIGLFILPRTWKLLAESVNVLLEGTPKGLKFEAIHARMLQIPGVQAVHDLHVWTVTSGYVALSGHVEVAEGADRDGALLGLRRALDSDFQIEHVTLQLETASLEQKLAQPCLPDSGSCYSGTEVRPEVPAAVR